MGESPELEIRLLDPASQGDSIVEVPLGGCELTGPYLRGAETDQRLCVTFLADAEILQGVAFDGCEQPLGFRRDGGQVRALPREVEPLDPKEHLKAPRLSSNSRTALLVGLATALGAGVSMGFSEALSDTGEQTGRGSGVVRGTITGAATALGGVFHSLPFIISDVNRALVVAGVVVAVELFVIAWVRHRFLRVTMRSSLIVETLGGAIVLAIGVAIGNA